MSSIATLLSNKGHSVISKPLKFDKLQGFNMKYSLEFKRKTTRKRHDRYVSPALDMSSYSTLRVIVTSPFPRSSVSSSSDMFIFPSLVYAHEFEP